MNEYKNLVGAPVRVTFENNVIIYLKKDELSIPFNNKIEKIEKHVIYSTLKMDTYYWEQIFFEVDKLKCIREKPQPKYYNKHVF
tara:strand:- start:288 stop:539 length:252 start_codon:yes stop_codon:yes gene_type:complete